MVAFQEFEEGTEVVGPACWVMVKGFGLFKDIANQLMAEEGLGEIHPDPTKWYPQKLLLNAFRRVAEEVGDNTLYQIGLVVPTNVVWPPEIDSIEKALPSIDLAFHMNHRNRRGQVLFDPERDPPMIEGIGHYHCRFSEGENKATMTCENPYPCAFDRGLIHAAADKFKGEKNVIVTTKHDDSKPCRKKGYNSCTYIITWDKW